MVSRIGYFFYLKSLVNIFYGNNFSGWGRKRTGRFARWCYEHVGGRVSYLEDGFIRSFGTGDHFPQLSLIEDDLGIYYDATVPSKLESILQSNQDVFSGREVQVNDLISQLIALELSKYNHAPDLGDHVLRSNDVKRVLVVDQTFGDMSLHYGGVDEQIFTKMFSTALAENPTATIYVKTHPEVSSGKKAGYFSQLSASDRVVLLRQPVSPISLLKQMDHIYVATSTMGFEGLLLGKTVTCFGLPWYSGWGVTDDRQSCPRRTKRRSVAELFATAYLDYTRYIDPITHQPNGQLEQVMSWIALQKQMAKRYSGRMIVVGFRRWKAYNIKPMLSLYPDRVIFVDDAPSVEALSPSRQDALICWGRDAPKGLAELAHQSGAKLLYMEDGFVRSVGLGSDLIPPLSLVLDAGGLYFDPRQASDLEGILSDTQFSEADIQQARAVRAYIVEHGITKYNIEPREQPDWSSCGKKVILVPGQVEDDASIRYGCTDINTNLGLLRSAREANPSAFIVYKPHPDVMSGNRIGKLALETAQEYADAIETHLSVVSCISACDEVHTMTSLTGFDALLRGKHVVVYGQPFYAGWGLTEDVLSSGVALDRRNRQLTLDELVAGTMLHYPIYWDWELKGYTTCMAVLHRIVETRTSLERSGDLDKLRVGFVRRQLRKAKILVKAGLDNS